MNKPISTNKPLKVVDGETDASLTPDITLDDDCGPIEPVADKPSRAEAEEAVRLLIKWAGDHPERDGLLETPARVVRS